MHDTRRHCALLGILTWFSLAPPAPGQDSLNRSFRWTASPPLVAPQSRDGESFFSVKDPTVVRHDGRWHLFCTVRGVKKSHQIEYISFRDWEQRADLHREILPLSDRYHCAPQVFYFTPHQKWYLIYQIREPSRSPELQPAYSTTKTLGEPRSWSKPTLFYDESPRGLEHWLDFWVICDDAKAHLFFTSLDGKLWRAETTVADFPHGWTQPTVVLEADIFEASHTYRLRGQSRYLTLVEAQGGGRRYFKAYLADRLDGAWTPIADRQDQPFAGAANVRFAGDPWAESISHGEVLRASNDEHLEIDPARMEFLFQGALDSEMAGKPYGEIPWRLGLLRAE